MAVWSQDYIEHLYRSKDKNGKRIIPNAGAITSNAFIHEQTTEDGRQERVIVINKTVALKKSALTAPSHELLHMVLFSVLNGPERTITRSDGTQVGVRITEKGVKLINGFLDLLPQNHRNILEESMEKRGYKHEENEDGSVNLNEPKAFEEYAEEYLNVYHDLVANEKPYL